MIQAKKDQVEYWSLPYRTELNQAKREGHHWELARRRLYKERSRTEADRLRTDARIVEAHIEKKKKDARQLLTEADLLETRSSILRTHARLATESLL